MKKQIFISIKTKLILISVFLVVFCTTLIGGYIIFQLPTITINAVGGDYINILESISNTIDMEKFAMIKSTDIGSSYYTKINEELTDIQKLLGMNHLYLLKKNDNGEFFQLSGRDMDADVASGATGLVDVDSSATTVSQNNISVTNAMKESFEGNHSFELEENSKWGKLLSIYLPLKDNNGQTIGVLLANLNGEPIYEAFTVVRNRIITLGIAVLLVGIIISILFAVVLVKSLKTFQKQVERIKEGDLTGNIKSKRNDEIGILGESFNSLNNTIANIIGKIREKSGELHQFSIDLSSISENIAHSSVESTHSVSEIAQGASQQADELMEVSQKLGEFNDTVIKIYKSLESTKENAEITNTLSNEGNIQLQGLNNSIRSSSEAFDIVADRINNLSENAQQIIEISIVMENIAAQTNLLALNAAIEATRAGEAGKGFTVVSGEIRKLAEQSKDSSDKIRVIVNEIIESVESVVTTSCDAKNKLTDQVAFVENTNKAFLSIIQSLDESVPVLQETFESANEMVISKDTIVERIESVTAVSQQTSAGAYEILNATEIISAQTQEIAAFSKTLENAADSLLSETDMFKIK